MRGRTDLTKQGQAFGLAVKTPASHSIQSAWVQAQLRLLADVGPESQVVEYLAIHGEDVT